MQVPERVPTYVGTHISQIQLTIIERQRLVPEERADVDVILDIHAAQKLMNWLGKLGLKPE